MDACSNQGIQYAWQRLKEKVGKKTRYGERSKQEPRFYAFWPDQISV